MNLENKVINFLGDSITEGAGTSAHEKRYFEILERRCKLKKANGYGISGTRIAKQKKPSLEPRWDLYFGSRVDEMDKNADAVVVFGGTNDYGHGDAPIGKFTDRTYDTFYGALHLLYQRLIERFPGKPIVILTPLHRLNEDSLRGEGVKEQDAAVLLEYVNIIKEVAAYYSLPVCDMYAISGIQPNVPIIKEMFCPDGLHPNDAGNEIMADRLEGFLRSL